MYRFFVERYCEEEQLLAEYPLCCLEIHIGEKIEIENNLYLIKDISHCVSEIDEGNFEDNVDVIVQQMYWRGA